MAEVGLEFELAKALDSSQRSKAGLEATRPP